MSQSTADAAVSTSPSTPTSTSTSSTSPTSAPTASTSAPTASPPVEVARRWNDLLAPFFGPDEGRSVRQLILTLSAYTASWGLAMWSLTLESYALTLLLCVPAAGFLVRLFMIQHDCGHGSFFRSRWASNAVGYAIGCLTVTPYRYWAATHARHHAHSGDLDGRGFGDIDTWTMREYRSRSWLGRLGYRLYRNPIVMLIIGPFWYFVVKHRCPWDLPRKRRREWVSVWWTNLGIGVLVSAGVLLFGWRRLAAIHLPIQVLAGGIGVWLFYVQHQFESTYWHGHEEWDFHDAALHGSSYLVLPGPLRWMTANIGLHHIHHLNARIPNYRLHECARDVPELDVATKVTIASGMRSLFLVLWDEEERRLVSFREARRLERARVARAPGVEQRAA